MNPAPGAEPEVFERGQPRDPERVVLGQLTVDVPLPGHHHGEVDQVGVELAGLGDDGLDAAGGRQGAGSPELERL